VLAVNNINNKTSRAIKSPAASNATNVNANMNANANTNATTVAELSSASTARVKRAWTLDSSTGIDKNANANADASTGAASLTSTTTAIDAGGISDYFRGMDMPQKLQVLGKISWFTGRAQKAQLVVDMVVAFSAFAQALIPALS